MDTEAGHSPQLKKSAISLFEAIFHETHLNFVILLKLHHLSPLAASMCSVMLAEMNSEVYPTDLDVAFI